MCNPHPVYSKTSHTATYNRVSVCEWPYFISHTVRVREAPGSNPGTPTSISIVTHGYF